MNPTKINGVTSHKISISAHLPRRKKNNRSLPDRTHLPASTTGPSLHHRVPLRRPRFKSSLPTIEEADHQYDEPLQITEATDNSGQSIQSSPGSMQDLDKLEYYRKHKKKNNSTRRAVTSIFEKRPTRSSLTLPPPIDQHSFMKNGKEDILVSQRRPSLVYDLLPPKVKSPSFMLRLDTDIPRPRFIITHRTYYQKFEELSLQDRQELIHTALNFVSIMHLPDSSLIIPLGCNSKCDTLFNTFYAYISVPSVYNFIKAYEQVKFNVPLWPSIRWVTSYWNMNFADNSVEKTYLQEVRNYYHKWNDMEVPHMEFKDHLPKRLLRRDMDMIVRKPIPCKSCQIIRCEKNNRIGFTHDGDIYREQVLSRWHFTELMLSYVKDHLKDRQNGCYIFLSLAERYLFFNDNKVYGFIQFDDGINYMQGAHTVD